MEEVKERRERARAKGGINMAIAQETEGCAPVLQVTAIKLRTANTARELRK